MMAIDTITKRWIANAADEKAVANGCRFDEARGQFVVDWIERYCVLYEGEKAGQSMCLEDWQYDATMRLFGWVRFSKDWKREVRRFNRAGIWIPKKNGKAMALDTLVPTPFGWMTIGALRPGDTIFSEDGKPCTVTQTHEVIVDAETYELTFSNGERIVCNGEHLWETTALQRSVHGAKGKPFAGNGWTGKIGPRFTPTAVRTTREIVDSLHRGDGASNHSIAMQKPLDLPARELPIDPYVFGCWLGDGDSDMARITCSPDDYETYCGEFVRAGFATLRNADNSSGAVRFRFQREDTGFPVRTTLRRMGVFRNKHIPAVYLRASIAQRLALLQGLMDTDGTILKSGLGLSYTTKLARLAGDIAELLSSLGVKHSTRVRRPIISGRERAYYTVEFHAYRETLPAFRLPRKLDRMRSLSGLKMRGRSATVQITAARRIAPVPVRCITVDNPTGLFLCGRTMIPTHNSPTLAAWGLYLLCGDGEQGQKVYSTAKDGKQALISHMHAVEMMRRSKPLSDEGKIHKTTWQINHLPSSSLYRVVAGDNPQSQEGLNGSVMVDECFIAGTMVATPNGAKRIEDIRPGEEVLCASGVGVVLGTSSRFAHDLYKVDFSDGTSFTCTGNHPVFTDRGWVAASALVNGAIAFGHEALSSLRRIVPAVEKRCAGRQDEGADGGIVGRATVLLNILRQEVDEPDVRRRDAAEGEQPPARDQASADHPSRQWEPTYAASIGDGARTRGGVGAGVGCPDRNGQGEWLSDLLQDRRGESGEDDRHRDRRPVSRHDGSTGAGPKESGVAGTSRVVGVSRLQREGACAVFNLHVGGHPSYFAEGHLVHNCHVVDRRLMSILKGAGISRSEPLHIEVSTAGNNPDGYGKSQWDYGVGVNAGEFEDQSFLYIAYAAPQDLSDADLDENLLKYARMANPTLGRIVKEEEFVGSYNAAKRSLSDLLDFKMYRLNIWQRSSNPWLKASDWTRCQRDFTEADLEGRECLAALDLSRTRDMSALVLVFPGDEEETYDLLPFFWLPEDVAREQGHLAPFLQWAAAGHLILTPGNVVDYGYIKATFRQLAKRFAIRELTYDMTYAEEVTQSLEQGEVDPTGKVICEGLGIPRVPFRQTIMEFALPTAEFERLVLAGKMHHNGHPVLSWQIGHVQVKTDNNQNKRPVKPKRDDVRKIDGVVAAIMGLGRLIEQPTADCGGVEFFDG